MKGRTLGGQGRPQEKAKHKTHLPARPNAAATRLMSAIAATLVAHRVDAVGAARAAAVDASMDACSFAAALSFRLSPSTHYSLSAWSRRSSHIQASLRGVVSVNACLKLLGMRASLGGWSAFNAQGERREREMQQVIVRERANPLLMRAIECTCKTTRSKCLRARIKMDAVCVLCGGGAPGFACAHKVFEEAERLAWIAATLLVREHNDRRVLIDCSSSRTQRRRESLLFGAPGMRQVRETEACAA